MLKKLRKVNTRKEATEFAMRSSKIQELKSAGFTFDEIITFKEELGKVAKSVGIVGVTSHSRKRCRTSHK